nr:hypothetical protein [Tanacetum cinerariifolium]
MNYKPIIAGTQSNSFEGTKASDNACQARKETYPVKDYILLPLWTVDLPFSQDPKSSHDDRSKPLSDNGKKVDEDQRNESEYKDQEKKDYVNSTNNVNIVSLTINAAGTNKDNELSFDPNMPGLEDVSIFNFLSDDEEDGAMADMNNLDTTIQFWSTAMAKTINEEPQIHARVDGKKIIITEASIRRDLQLADEEGVDCLPNSTIFEQLVLMGPKTTACNEFSSTVAYAIICLATNQKFNFSKWIFDSMIRNMDNVCGKFLMYLRFLQVFLEHVADEAMRKELRDSFMRADTTASSLEAEQDSGGSPRCQEAIGDTTPQTRFESVSKHSNYSLLARGNTLRSDEDRMKLNELMELCTSLQTRVLDLEKTKTYKHNEIASLKRRVKKLEKRNRSRTHKLKRLYKVGLTARVESSEDQESLGEDTSKQGRIKAIDTDEDITLVNDQDDANKDMFYVNDLGGEEVFVAEQEIVKDVNANVVEETSKPKVKGIVIQEQEEPGKSTTIATISKHQSQDKGKAIMIEEPMKPKKKDQIRLDEKVAKRLQAEFNKEERLVRERAQKEQEANIALIET